MESQPESILRGNERILVVDDNESVVTLARFMLERLGYKVNRVYGWAGGVESLLRETF